MADRSEYFKQYGKAYRATNKERLRQQDRERYPGRAARMKETGQSYRKDHKAEIKAKDRLRQSGNAKHLDKCKEYRLSHRLERNAYYRNKRLSDPSYRILSSLRSRLRDALTNNGKKKANTIELIGCTIDDLVNHLESQFEEGMTWDNYGRNSDGTVIGRWVIDHIKPCAAFDLTSQEAQKECFHYSNLRPLWGKDNLRKGAVYALVEMDVLE